MRFSRPAPSPITSWWSVGRVAHHHSAFYFFLPCTGDYCMIMYKFLPQGQAGSGDRCRIISHFSGAQGEDAAPHTCKVRGAWQPFKLPALRVSACITCIVAGPRDGRAVEMLPQCVPTLPRLRGHCDFQNVCITMCYFLSQRRAGNGDAVAKSPAARVILEPAVETQLRTLARLGGQGDLAQDLPYVFPATGPGGQWDAAAKLLSFRSPQG
jgi:hypothetical protein